ncbi:MAG: hypothetical protein QOG93_1585 [Gaiellaceae bacterium]|jgi:hypothetical protein|nr:hypothetical protein [Gaiellaceae bacterium]MDX6435270.1 hypothetical protein [Gaiellaceae bacterium]
MVGRAAALLALGTALALYYAFHERLWNASTWWDIAFISLVLIPACFAIPFLLLPLRDAPGLLWAALGFAVGALLCHLVGWNTPENFCKLLGVTAVGFWFLRYFESLSWVVLVALIIPWVDAYSVWRGPTKVIVTQHREVFTNFSFAFAIPGETSAANLGLPDLLFFTLFLAASARWELRVRLTWLLLTLSFGGTLALAVWRDIGGLPALPLLSLGFLVANGDLLWTRVRRDLAEARARKESAPTEP